jgi:hypothetical protein
MGLELSSLQAEGLATVVGFASQKAAETLFAEIPDFDIRVETVEHFASVGCEPAAHCDRGHPLRHKWIVTSGHRSNNFTRHAFGLTCLSHLRGMTETEKRLVACIGSWTNRNGYRELIKLFAIGKERGKTGQTVYEDWKQSSNFHKLQAALPEVAANFQGATVGKTGRDRARLMTSCEIADFCGKHELPVPRTHINRILRGYMVLSRRGLLGGSATVTIPVISTAISGIPTAVVSVPTRKLPVAVAMDRVRDGSPDTAYSLSFESLSPSIWGYSEDKLQGYLF